MVRAHLTRHLRALHGWLDANAAGNPDTEAHRFHLHEQIERFLNRTHDASTPAPDVRIPPGSPIGQDAPAYHQRQAERRTWLEAALPKRAVCHAPW
ncbi:MAG: hypothetical protein PPP56_01120, partial [Longimonas sp.]|uniref:hypothetical protein n=1 Tax=Longimonas sp. TaxID=2039626 RepID=UPI00335293B7